MNMGFEIISNYEDVFNLDRTAEHIWSVPSNTASDNYYITELLPADFKRGYNHENWSYIRGTENDYQPGWQIFCMRWDFMTHSKIAISAKRQFCVNMIQTKENQRPK